MRWMKILLVVSLSAAVFASLAGPASAQTHIGCSSLAKSTKDTIQTQFFSGRPGDTVQMPLFLKNDSICTAFQFLIQFDTSKLAPLFQYDSICDSTFNGQCVRYLIDSGFIDYTITGRFVKTRIRTTPFGDVLDTVTKFQANLFEGRKNVIASSFLPQLSDIDSIPGGRAPIFYLKFKVKPTALHNQIAGFSFFQSDIYIIDSAVFPPDTTWFNGCNASQMTVAWNPPPNTQTIQIYPNYNAALNGVFRVDTSTVPNPTITLTANPTNISAGNSSNLQWTATNSDSIVIRDGIGGLVTKQTSLTGSVSVSPGSTTTYTGTAYKASKTAVAQATVTVGTSLCPVSISFTPSTQSYTINQGETVSFQVRGTGNTGQTITLSSGTLPNNATFAPSNPVIGTTTATGTFSFTPDFNQKGGFSVTFNASNGTCSAPTASVLITVNEIEKDRLFSTSALKQKPVGGLRGTGGIKFPINLISAKTVYGVQFDMDYPYNYVSVDSFVVTNRIPDYAVYDNLGETPGTVRVTTFGLVNDSVKTDVSSAILYAYMTLDSNAMPWTDYPINMRNGRESVNPDPNFPTLELQTDSGIVQCDNPGDVNLDKFIDVGDVVNIVSSIIQTFTLNPRQFATADIIKNDSVNVFDLVADINLIYNRPINPAPPAPPAPATMALSYGDIPMGGSDMLVVTSELPEEVAAVQMDIGYDPNAVTLGVPKVTVDNANFIVQYKNNGVGKMRVLLYAFGSYNLSELLQAGKADLVSIPLTAKTNIQAGDKNQLRIAQAFLSTPTSGSIAVQGVDIPLPSSFVLSQNYPNPFNPVTTIEYSLGTFEDGSFAKHVQLEIYNVLGQLVRTLVDGEQSAGSYREEWDATNLGGQRVSSGVYLYRLRVGDENQTKKMLLLK